MDITNSSKVEELKEQVGGLTAWGCAPGKAHAFLAACGEIGSGLFLAMGLLTSFAALGFVGLMSVAYWTVHSKNGFMIINEGWEYVFILAISAVTVAMIGPGNWSIDHKIGWDNELDGYAGLLISAGGGTLAALTLLASFTVHRKKSQRRNLSSLFISHIKRHLNSPFGQLQQHDE